jgi:hypothetical protein
MMREPRGGPILALDQLAAHVARRFHRPAELFLARSMEQHERGLTRWIIGRSDASPAWMELWLPGSSSESAVYRTLREAGFEVTWADCYATGSVVPAVAHSWSFLWTVGPVPLRIWRRHGSEAVVLLDFSRGRARGTVLGSRDYAFGDIGPARVESSWLKISCVVATPDGNACVASRLQLAAPLFVWLAELAGALDPEPPAGTPVELLASRINEALDAMRRGTD